MSASEATLTAASHVIKPPENHETIENSLIPYHVLQIRLAFFMLLFWITVYYFLKIKNGKRKLQAIQISSVVFQRVLELKHVKYILDMKETVLEFISQFDIRRFQSVLKKIRTTLSTIKIIIQKYKLTSLIAKINSTIINFRKISKSFAQIGVSILQCVKKPLEMINRVKQGIASIKKQIAQMWAFMEQIVQIVRLPIEILKAISLLVFNAWMFIGRLQKPRFRI